MLSFFYRNTLAELTWNNRNNIQCCHLYFINESSKVCSLQAFHLFKQGSSLCTRNEKMHFAGYKSLCQFRSINSSVSTMTNFILSFLSLTFIQSALGQFDPHFIDGRQGIVHLFEWKWLDIAQECEEFLGPKGYGGVQTSPVNENVVIQGRPWFERYQPMSFKLTTRSGTEKEFKEMVQRCRNAGVRIFVDVVVNHMAAPGPTSTVIGTAGSTADPLARDFPDVPFNRSHFHQACSIQNYSNATEVRFCELSSLPDLNQANQHVRSEIIDFLNRLVDLGVAGFRMDACKHMSPSDLRIIYGSVKALSSSHGFQDASRPFFFQEVIDVGNEAVRRQEYTTLGTVTEFTYSTQIGMVFRKIERNLTALQQWGPQSGFLPSRYSFVFVDNHGKL